MFKWLFGGSKRAVSDEIEAVRSYVRKSGVFLKKLSELDPVRRAGFRAIVELHVVALCRRFGGFDAYRSAPAEAKSEAYVELQRAFADARRPGDDMFGINNMAEQLVLMHLAAMIVGERQVQSSIERAVFSDLS